MKLLIIDDEPTIVETIETKFRREGYTTFTADSAEEGMRLFRRVKPDLVILDIMLPQRSGFDFCRAVRKESSTPILMVSARGDETDRIKGLELGADDYVVKPFNLSELVARVKAILRRATGEPVREVIERGNLRIDPRSHEAWLEGETLTLSPKEFALLYFLASNPGHVFSRETLLDRVWGRDAFVSARTVDVHVRWLRTRIESAPDEPVRILTVRGVGYKFAA
ncbi:response regulator transcription factor [Fimbriimonas ginsengisoli]|uniref:Winged helix family two component transcriptional regulator n=1 Tax=Fimbriimonas ginsengisoli Gsoil 348 TaxID=661478 RepID=A0A068NSR9_FIMGI|nr:response regulator transcription factor [Fimbriimonas ginsengisoli]AIE86548.1 winged helix family two component transcriptional regulator [Fimbriimonas ginsengisoli Gsoil 348]